MKYWTAKIASPLIAEAMECIGGDGYVEESRLPRLHRDAPVQAIWAGTGNTLCLEIMQLPRRSPEPLETVLAGIEDTLGTSAKSTLNVLRAAAAVALADAFIETRLSKPRPIAYGMLDSRFDARAFVDYICRG
ncbi:acyl-CoA dehydrogenase family protein [Bauldia sp.]|uniref:acyl-CoA dehydrogenase family protein n=1 Tax=Bauldia sp. TaxID=2575872 RepID=UPI003BA854B0